MLRRSESSWRKEFITRYRTTRRWAYSTTPTIAHVPHYSPVAGMHLLSENALLSASIQYGVVSRSLPLNGKILKGFLDASGTLNGLGIGNPNAEFSPNVSACALTSEGKTAKIAWGYRNGEVAVTTAAKAVDSATRGPASLVRCQVEDQHVRPVKEIIWDGAAVVSSDVHGVVKLWDAKRVRCVWTSPEHTPLVPDLCSKLVSDVAKGVIAVGFNSGRIIIYTGFAPNILDPAISSNARPAIRQAKIDPPVDQLSGSPVDPEGRPISSMFIDPRGETEVSVLYSREDDPNVYRLTVKPADGSDKRLTLGGGAFGPVRSFIPCFGTKASEADFAVVGYELGTVSIYSWGSSRRPSADLVQATRTFEAYGEAVTALARNSSVLLTGSEHGVVKVWDLLTLGALRAFHSPSGRGEIFAVSQIILENEMFVASVGSCVLAWKAGPVSRRKTGRWNISGMKKTKSGGAMAKWHQQYELKRDIADSRRALAEEQSKKRAIYGREREQRNTLDHLGLNEVEAVEYVLMLSRDEEERRRVARGGYDEGVFEGDFDEDAVTSDRDTPSPISPSERRLSQSSTENKYARASPPSSSTKVQVSPRFRPEPMEAGFSGSPLPSSRSLPVGGGAGAVSMSRLPSIEDGGEFPPVIASSVSSASGTPSSSLAGGFSGPGSPAVARSAGRSAWSMGSPFQRPASVAGSPESMRGLPARAIDGASSSQGAASFLSTTKPAAADEDEDEELKFVLELSLAEARSRGEVV
ncbi:hypothetical protein PUNSTDRAFT_106754 [Punctularia strigosozonata HHB-11173 SS5]|uniref:uncharacterized protein n=1 Tax=Punctularia strigosozonata (strain HHB-11173) TaxID=741275 RepID=UPI0004416BAC|nr:uncharacterized protein PUNSTDRAFT_106754 [Punctularia strigosozonata HHB-11173 SS5]EIN05759.1 hypothetical protein PUNSTDRAFT_106754 [Punctularia strigosozonata HHB-11173 SS5]